MLDITKAQKLPSQEQLILVGLNSHIQSDKIAQRRIALITILSDGSPHKKEELFERIEQMLGAGCWGQIKSEALLRDLNVLRKGGIRIAYSRKPAIQGYYLAFPSFDYVPSYQSEEMPKALIRAIKALKPDEKTLRAFAAADFAFNQKRLILKEQRPDWSDEKIDKVSRQIVYGVEEID